MSAPFAPGDVVVRVAGDPWPMPIGAIDRVVWCGESEDALSGEFGWGLELQAFDPGLPSDGDLRPEVWCAENFRKIDDEVTEDFRAQLKSLSKPKERTEA